MNEYVSAFLYVNKDIKNVKDDLKEYFSKNNLNISQNKDSLEFSTMFVKLQNHKKEKENENLYHLYLKVDGDNNKIALEVLNKWIGLYDGVSIHMDPTIDKLD